MFNSNNGYSLSDVAAVTGRNNNDDAFGNNGWWIIILLLAFGGWGNGGWGGNGNSGTTTREEVAYGFDINGLESGVRGVQQGLCDGFYAMNTGMLNGFSGIQSTLCQGFSGVNDAVRDTGAATLQAINADTVAGMQNTNALTAQLCQMSADNAACCCETQRQIERGFADINYNLATQECQTRQAIADSTKSIIDFLTQDKIATLQAENQSLKFAASQQAQNAYLVRELSNPYPVPAYIVANPNASYGCNNGCCCG